MLKEFEQQKGKWYEHTKRNIMIYRRKNSVEKYSMKKEHTEHLDLHKAVIEQQKITVQDMEK